MDSELYCTVFPLEWPELCRIFQYSRHDRATGYVTEQMEHNNFYHWTTGNHSGKTFHKDLMNLKAIPCKVVVKPEYTMKPNPN